MNQQTYFEQNKDFITQTKLKDFIKNKEAYKLKWIDWILIDDSSKKSLLIWQAFDTYTTDFVNFSKKYFILPQGKDKRSELAKKADEEWRIVLNNTEADQLLKMTWEVNRQPLFDMNGKYEFQKEIIVEYKWYKLKAKLDRFNLEKWVIRDFKTTNNSDFAWWIIGFDKNIQTYDEYWYLFQMAFYRLLCEIQYEKPFECYLDVVDWGWKSMVYKFKRETLDNKKQEIIYALDWLIAAYKNNDFCETDRIKSFDSDYYPHMKSSIQLEYNNI